MFHRFRSQGGAAPDGGLADECSWFRAGHGPRTETFWRQERLLLWDGASCLERRQKGWMLSVRAARGVGHGFVLGCRPARGREHPALSASQPPAGEVRDTAGQDALRLSARACGCGMVGRGSSAAGCFLGTVAVTLGKPWNLCMGVHMRVLRRQVCYDLWIVPWNKSSSLNTTWD